MSKHLNEQQQELVANNHNLIYKYASYKNLPVDEYYDILAIGLCKAALSYDKDKGHFSTIAYLCMHNEVCNYYKSITKKSTIPENIILSYDVGFNGDDIDEYTFLETILDEKYNDDFIVNKIITESIIEKLDDKEKKIINLFYIGLNKGKICEVINCSRYILDNHIKSIKGKCKSVLV